MNLRYGLDDRPPLLTTALLALQWLALSLPFVVIVGAAATAHSGADPALRAVYLQKAAFFSGLMILVQAFVGHRLPLVAGPSVALLLGVVGSRASPDAVYTAAAVCGGLLAILSATGLFRALQALFTPRVIATVLLLIAFTMTPTLVRLVTGGTAGTPAQRLAFSAALVAALVVAHRLLPASRRSLLIVCGMALGALAHRVVFGPGAAAPHAEAGVRFLASPVRLVFDGGALVSFLICTIALALNEMGSMQALQPLLSPDHMEARTRRGMTVAGVVNALAGLFGVVGPVDYSLSPGVIAASGCGSRFPLVPAAVLTLAASFWPAVLEVAGAIPPPVVGSTLLYAVAGQVASGLGAVFLGGAFTLEDGLVLGLPLVGGTVVASLPPEVVAGLPDALAPLAGNGFAVGVVAVLALDRLFPRRWPPPKSTA